MSKKMELIKKWPILFILSFVFGCAIFGVLYKYQVFMYYLVAGVFLFFIGMPTGTWFKGINKQFLYAMDVAIVLVFLINIFVG